MVVIGGVVFATVGLLGAKASIETLLGDVAGLIVLVVDGAGVVSVKAVVGFVVGGVVLGAGVDSRDESVDEA
jgi:hypothetical protein